MIKKLISIILVLAFTFMAIPFTYPLKAFAANWQDALYYETSDNGTGVIITDCKKTVTGALTVPSEIGGLPVVEITEWAFSNCVSLTHITIPSGITSINDATFYGCTSLLSVIIPNSVTNIGNGAFYSCSSLTGIEIPNSVTLFGNAVFFECVSLLSVTIPESVISIGNYAFLGCSSLTAINVNSGNINYSSIDGVLFNKNATKLIQYPCHKSGIYTIPNSVTSIGEAAFDSSTELTGITIGNSVTQIGESAFWGCTNLQEIIIPDSVTSIGSSAFDSCTSLLSATIGKSVTRIPDSAFWGCTSLMSVIIPDSVIGIDDWAFSGCASLMSIKIPNSVKSIGDRAFGGCASLSSVIIPQSVKSIGKRAFSGCASLNSVTIPRSVTDISDGAFDFTSAEFTIRCFDKSTAEQYAINNNIPYVFIDWFLLKEQSVYGIDDDLCRFYAEASNNSAGDIILGLKNMNIELYKDGKQLKGSDKAGTGCEIRLIVEETVLDAIKIVVKGDLNGDGAVDALDAFLSNSALNNHSSLSDTYLDAANVDTANMDFDINDYAALLNLSVGKTLPIKLELKVNSTLSIDNENGFLRGVLLKQTVTDILQNFKQNSIVIYKNALPLSPLDIVGTGCVVKLLKDGLVIDELTIVIKGDINGDGVIDALDVFLSNSALNNHISLSDIFIDAANVDTSNMDFDINDYAAILNLAVNIN
ncbi:MAG TPA: leucine-rich repeat protein [Clostridia bacterium]|nr:leucine-rich repeat protein [Clostridia bacterium]